MSAKPKARDPSNGSVAPEKSGTRERATAKIGKNWSFEVEDDTLFEKL